MAQTAAMLSYGVPVLSVAVVVVVGHWLHLYLQAAAVSLFVCAVMFSAWLGGFRPGLLAIVLSALSFKFFFVPRILSLSPETDEILRLMVFLLATFFVGWLAAKQRSTTEALRESERLFRDYTETASDWFWETGPDHSFTRISEAVASLGPANRIGLKRWEFATDVEEEPEKWNLHTATLEAHRPFRAFVYRTAAADGFGLPIRKWQAGI